MSKPLLKVLFIFSPFFLLAQQDLDQCWERTYLAHKNGSETIHDAFLTPDGHMALVGSVKNVDKEKGLDGLFMIVDAESGEVKARRTFPEFGDDVLEAVVWGDYSFFAVGYTNKGEQKGQNAWLLELDWQEDVIEILSDTTFGTNKKDTFKEIIWTNNSTAIIAGTRESHKGDVWIVEWDGQKSKERTLGAGKCEELVAMDKGSAGKIWLCGNTYKGKDCNVWWMQLDENKVDYFPDFIGSKTWEKVYDGSCSPKGGFTMVGENWQRSGEDADMWLLEIDADRNLKHNIISGANDEEKITTTVKSPQGKYWTSLLSISAGFGMPLPVLELGIWNEVSLPEFGQRTKEEIKPDFEKRIILSKNVEFEAVQMLQTSNKSYVLAGNVIKGKKRHSQIHLICWQDGELWAARGAKRVQNSEPKLIDRDRNGVLSPNELGAIKFQLTNVGDVDIMEGRIKIEGEGVVDGLKLKRQEIKLLFLPLNEPKNYSFPLEGLNNLATGQSKFKITVMVDEKEIHSFYAHINSGSGKTAASTIVQSTGSTLDWAKPNIRATGSRNVPVVEDGYEIKINVNANRPLSREDFKVSRNGITLIDNKNENGTLNTPLIDGKIFKYVFTYKVLGLVEGENRIEVRLADNEKTTPITINYQPIQPNLHILAIGPTYDDLQYSAKDAQDFAEAVKPQGGRGFFNKVFVKTLVSSQETVTTNIAKEVKRLAKKTEDRDREDYIKSNDYVLFFFSGHGVTRSGRFKLLPTDYDPDFEEDTTLDYRDKILNPLTNINAKVIVFIDACLSGHAKGLPSRRDLNDALLEANRAIPGIITISSCSKNQLSYEHPKWENGAFTKALIEALNGQSVTLENGENIHPDLGLFDENNVKIENDNNRIIVIGELIEFLKKRVPDLVLHEIGENQVPDVPTEKLEKTLHLFTLK